MTSVVMAGRFSYIGSHLIFGALPNKKSETAEMQSQSFSDKNSGIRLHILGK